MRRASSLVFKCCTHAKASESRSRWTLCPYPYGIRCRIHQTATERVIQQLYFRKYLSIIEYARFLWAQPGSCTFCHPLVNSLSANQESSDCIFGGEKNKQKGSDEKSGPLHCDVWSNTTKNWKWFFIISECTVSFYRRSHFSSRHLLPPSFRSHCVVRVFCLLGCRSDQLRKKRKENYHDISAYTHSSG